VAGNVEGSALGNVSAYRVRPLTVMNVLVVPGGTDVLPLHHTGMGMANLASTFWNQERWKEAEELEVQVMETSLRVLGPEHPDTLTAMNNLAFTLKGRGHNAEAIKLMEERVRLGALVLGAGHPDILYSSAALIEWQTERLDIDALAKSCG